MQAQQGDTLSEIKLLATLPVSPVRSATPVQVIHADKAEAIAALSAADALKLAAGVLVQDYGGVGGMKTVNLRSLGTGFTGLQYDYVPVQNTQTAQTDLGRYPIHFIDYVLVYQAHAGHEPVSALSMAAGSLLHIQSQSVQQNGYLIKAFMQAGSSGLLNPGLLLGYKKNRWSATGNAQWLQSSGRYKYKSYEKQEFVYRDSSAVNDAYGELNIKFDATNNQFFTVKMAASQSKRQLPGAVVLFNTPNADSLKEQLYFVQVYGRSHSCNEKWNAMYAGKYSHHISTYTDPVYLNAWGRIHNRYTQKEAYASVGVSYKVSPLVNLSTASDVVHSLLNRSDIQHTQFEIPKRLRFLQHFTASIVKNKMEWHSSLLFQYVHDAAPLLTGMKHKQYLLPFGSILYRLNSNMHFRAFYKQSVRLPSFNDLYYTLVGNTSLVPEKANQFNVGFTATIPTRTWKYVWITADVYHNDVSNKILAVPRLNLFQWSMQNIGRVKINGIDVQATGERNISNDVSIQARLAYTFQLAKDYASASSPKYKQQLPYTPVHSGSLVTTLSYKKTSINYSVLYSSERYLNSDPLPEYRLKPYSVHTLQVSQVIQKQKQDITLSLSLKNLTNTQYELIKYYPMPGLQWQVGIFYALQQLKN